MPRKNKAKRRKRETNIYDVLIRVVKELTWLVALVLTAYAAN